MSEEDFDKAIGLKMDATAQEGGPEGAKQGKQEQNLVAKVGHRQCRVHESSSWRRCIDSHSRGLASLLGSRGSRKWHV